MTYKRANTIVLLSSFWINFEIVEKYQTFFIQDILSCLHPWVRTQRYFVGLWLDNDRLPCLKKTLKPVYHHSTLLKWGLFVMYQSGIDNVSVQSWSSVVNKPSTLITTILLMSQDTDSSLRQPMAVKLSQILLAKRLGRVSLYFNSAAQLGACAIPLLSVPVPACHLHYTSAWWSQCRGHHTCPWTGLAGSGRCHSAQATEGGIVRKNFCKHKTIQGILSMRQPVFSPVHMFSQQVPPRPEYHIGCLQVAILVSFPQLLDDQVSLNTPLIGA